MEVFLKNVPLDLSEGSLKKELQPFIKALGIVHFACHKPRHKSFAWLVFITEAEGNKFLTQHGAAPRSDSSKSRLQLANGVVTALDRPRDMARLFILKMPIYAARSNRKVDKHIISSLRLEREERLKAPDRTAKTPTLRGSVTSVSLGKIMFSGPDKKLTYVPCEEHFTSARVHFGRKIFMINLLDRELRFEGRLDIPVSSIQEVVVGQASHTLTLVLIDPPRFYSPAADVEGLDVLSAQAVNKASDEWKRMPGLPSWKSSISLLGQCLVYRLNISPTAEMVEPWMTSAFSQIVQSLQSRDNLTITLYELPDRAPGSVPDLKTSVSSFEDKLARYATVRDQAGRLLPYTILFQVQALVWNNYVDPESGIRMLEIMEGVARDPRLKANLLTTDAMKQLFQRIPYPCPGVQPEELDVQEFVTDVMKTEIDRRSDDPLRSGEHGARLPEHQAWVLKAMVTPTRITLSGPDAESKNRVLRKYSDRTSYFLRVTFCDEDGEDLTFNSRVSNDAIFERYRKIMRGGIRVAGRFFEFLGFSHSSLRSHSAWFTAEYTDKDFRVQNCSTILNALGNFDDIRVPARCAARVGQAFSETPYSVPIFDRGIQIRYIPDVKSADGSRVFSDGVGTLSWEAMQEVWDCLPLKNTAPTCFQIRWAGVKGMVALDSRLKGTVMCIRKESMMKFQSNDLMEMGICDASHKPLRFVLNRQIIKLLEDVGTDDGWFLRLQRKALDVLRDASSEASHTTKFLQYHTIGVNVGLPSFIKHTSNMGIEYRRDPFLKSVVEHVVLRELRLLKHKARIPVDKGVTLFGIMDETGFLKEDEVYVTFERFHAQGLFHPEPLLEGPVIVTRSPALHPGDIRVVSLVTPPRGHPLLDVRNCIVFSQKGERDLPSQMSGGDLDGDLYNIIWDPFALPELTCEAASYPRVLPQPLDRPVNRDDMSDFFVTFMQTDVLGMIATRHQILADVQPLGTRDPVCKNLAEMHSTAVDFSKTGIAVNPSEIPKPPRTRPDFLSPAPPLKLYELGRIDHIADHDVDDEDDEEGMGQTRHRYHRSEKILGRLYREVDERKIWSENIQKKVKTDGPAFWEEFLNAAGAKLRGLGLALDFTKRLDDAWKIRDIYEESISNNMWQFSSNPRVALTEVEVFSGSVMNKTGSQTRRQRDSSIKLKEEVDRLMAWVVDLIRDRGGGGGGGDSESTAASETGSHEETLEMCWACLAVGCRSPQESSSSSPGYHGTGELRSFRVVAACCLMREMDALAKVKKTAGEGRRKMVVAMR